MATYSTFHPDVLFPGVQGTTLPATSNVIRGEWLDLPNGTQLNMGDIVLYMGSSFMVNTPHIKEASTVVPPGNSYYTLLAETGPAGETLYTWFAFADSADGVTNFTVGPGEGRAYIGIASNKTTPVESTNPADYTWSRIQGAAAKLLYVATDRQLITYDATGVLVPTVQTVLFTIFPQALTSGTYTISMTRADGTVINANTYLTAVTGTFAPATNSITWSGSGTQFSMTAANFTAAKGTTQGVIVHVVHADGVGDSVSIVSAPAGANGEDGQNAKLLYLTSDRQLIGYSAAGVPEPSDQPTTFTINAQYLTTGTYSISMKRADGTVINANTYLTALSGSFAPSGNNINWTGSGTQFLMTAANFDSARGTTNGVIVGISHTDGPSDDISILKTQDGAPGDPGPPGPSIRLSATDATFDYIDWRPVNSNQLITVTATNLSATPLETLIWTQKPIASLIDVTYVDNFTATVHIDDMNKLPSLTLTVEGSESGVKNSITLYTVNKTTRYLVPDYNFESVDLTAAIWIASHSSIQSEDI